MKKAILTALCLAGLALLAGCVHPNDLDTIAPVEQADTSSQD